MVKKKTNITAAKCLLLSGLVSINDLKFEKLFISFSLSNFFKETNPECSDVQ